MTFSKPDIGDGLWKSHFPEGRWHDTPSFRRSRREYNSGAKLCAYLLRHGRSHSHGHDGGPTEVQRGAGSDSRRPFAGTPKRHVEFLVKEMTSQGFRCFCVAPDQPLALRAVQGHPVLEAEPRLVEWRQVCADMSPPLYHGTLFDTRGPS